MTQSKSSPTPHLQLGSCDYPEHVPPDRWVPYARQQKELGLTYVRVAEFAWSRMEPRSGEYDWAWLDTAIDAYYDAHMDLVQPWPEFNLYNRDWPLYTRQSVSPPAKLVRGASRRPGSANDSILAQGVVISGGTVAQSVLSTDVRVANEAWVEQSVLLDSVVVGEGAHVRNAILDKNVVVPPGARIGFDRAEDEANGYTVTESGLTVLAKGQKVPQPR